MSLKYIQHATEQDAQDLIDTIDVCKGWPSGGTETWAFPLCFQDGYSPTATTESYFVIVNSEVQDCLTQDQWDSRVSLPDGWVKCGTEAPISGTT